MPFSFRTAALNFGTSVLTNTISNAISRKSGRGGSYDFADLNNFSEGLGKLGMKNLRYPLDVEAAPGLGNQGHYIMFFINEQTRSQLKVGYEGMAGGFDEGRNLSNAPRELTPLDMKVILHMHKHQYLN